MRVALVNPPRSEFDRSELGPPLGLLRLARAATDAGWTPEIVDFNLLWHTTPSIRDAFYEAATATLISLSADVYGFTSMAVDSHVAIELARRLKEALPDARVVFGGTHFSAFAAEAQTLFPWIDDIVKGEGEAAFASLLAPDTHDGNVLIRGSELDYAAVDLTPYLSVNTHRVVNVESARGCRYKCAFCYSPSHYPKRRTLDTNSMLEELEYLQAQGVKHVFFVEDNFLNDEARALSVCAAIEEAQLDLTWRCYATLPQLTDNVVRAMANAGCRSIFTGIDAVGVTSQRRYGKKVTGQAHRRVEACIENGIVPTCAFLVAPPSHPCGADAELTAQTALEMRALGALVRLNILAYYPQSTLVNSSPVHMEWDEDRVRLELDVPDVVAANSYACSAPTLFPFHSRYVGALEWKRFVQQTHVLFTLLHARTDELLELSAPGNIDLFGLADNVLCKTGDLLRLEKGSRRRIEADAFDALKVQPARSRWLAQRIPALQTLTT
jgi:hypothetical protein